MQNRQPMQRCMSIITMPSCLRLNVAWVGQTRTQAGFSQWLQSTIKGISLIFSSMYGFSWSGNALSYFSFHIHLISSLMLPKSGTLWTVWHALMVFWKSSSVLNLLMSTTMAQCSAFNPSLFGSTWGGLIPFIQTLCVADAAVAPSPRMEEMPAIFKNCLLSMLMICHPPSGRYDNPSSRALRPYSCGIHRRTFSYLHGIACIQSAGSCYNAFPTPC